MLKNKKLNYLGFSISCLEFQRSTLVSLVSVALSLTRFNCSKRTGGGYPLPRQCPDFGAKGVRTFLIPILSGRVRPLTRVFLV
jgi:hypothetical protein